MLSEFWSKYGFIGVAAGWVGLSLVINTLLKMQTAAQWVDQLKKNKIGAIAVHFMETIGVDPASFIVNFKKVVDDKAGD
jgi:hypothetical protein